MEIEPKIAGLLCAAILSDTLIYRSPTCTREDEEAAEDLARLAGVEVESFAKEMFNAGSNLRNKTPEEIFFQDFKKFSANDITFGVGQINSMSSVELSEIREKLIPHLEQTCKAQNIQMLFFMLTDIIKERTQLLYYGENASELVKDAFGIRSAGGYFVLKGVVSRKKQFIPSIIEAMQH